MDVIKWQTFAANNIYSVCVCVRASAISVFPPQGLSVNSSVYEDISDIMNCLLTFIHCVIVGYVNTRD